MKLTDYIKEAISRTYVPEARAAHIALLEECSEPDPAIVEELDAISDRLNHVEEELAEYKRAERTGW